MINLQVKKEILEKIIDYNTIIIVRHIRPDGDCLGSSLGLRAVIRNSFPEKKVYSVGRDKSDYLSFVGKEDDALDVDRYREALVIVVDTATRDRIDDDNYNKGKCLIKIDHHIPVDAYGDINYIRKDLPATALIIADLCKTFPEQLKINKEAAYALLVGTITDTGRFKYSGINEETFSLSGYLLKQDVNLPEIYNLLYAKEPNEAKFQGYILKHFRATKDGVAHFTVTKRVLKKFNITLEAASAQINQLDGIKGYLIWMFFIKTKQDYCRVRIRSRFVSINELAAKYEGGGHANAAGATIYNKQEKRKLIREANELVKNFKKQNQGKV